MRRTIVNIIKEEIADWNKHERKIPREDYILFKIEDFDYLEKYYNNYGSEFETTKFIDFCSTIVLAELASLTQRRSIWYWEGIEKDFIIPQLNFLSSLAHSYVKLKDNKEYKVAFIVFRSFIEVSSQFYACFLDLDFFKKYLSEEINDDYRKHWFKNLKPEKVLSVLRRINQDYKTEVKKTGIDHGDMRAIIYPFESEQRNFLYQQLTSYTHGKYEVINNKINITEIKELKWRITEYIVSAINLIAIISRHFLTNEKFDRRKHVIFQQIWYSIKYKN